jgi:hypothetical protein
MMLPVVRIQGAFTVAVHAHVDGAVTLIVPLPPVLLTTASPVGAIVTAQGGAPNASRRKLSV